MKKMEYRFASELRTDSQGDEMAIAGYAALFNSKSKDLGGFRETIAPGAFTRSLKNGDDVKALVNHDPNQLLGRSKNGTLILSQDERGLKFRVMLNPKSTAHRDLYASIERGDLDGCSFAFTVDKDGQDWDDEKDEDGNYFASRTLKDVNLLDTSVVTYPAYNGTSVGARSLFNDAAIAEIRSFISALQAKRADSELGEEDECFEEAIAEVSKALNEKFPAPADSKFLNGQYYTIETYDDYVIACDSVNDGYAKITYHEDEVNETFLFGEPQPVEKEWVPAERSKKRAEEIRNHLANMVAEHKAKADEAAKQASAHNDAAAAIEKSVEEKKAYRLANGLIDDEDYEDDVFIDPLDIDNDDERAAAIASETRADGKVRTKKVGGKNLTKDKFAFVGDPQRTETWKLPVHDVDHARNALARFNQTDGIPADKKAGVYRKIVAAAKKFGIEVSDEEKSRMIASLPFDEIEMWQRKVQLALVALAN